MKKLLFLALLMTIGLFVSSCSSCSNKETQENKQQAELVVENLISADREYMFTQTDGVYGWYETAITLDEYVDADDCDGSVAEVTNIFQYVNKETNDIEMLLITHRRDTTIYDIHHTIRMGYSALNDAPIKLTFKDAYQRLTESNTVKPHTRSCSLCLNSVPGCDTAEYIFSTDTVEVCINAVTGDVTSDVYTEE